MLEVTNEFKDAMKAPIKVLNAKAHFLSLQKKSKNLLDAPYIEPITRRIAIKFEAGKLPAGDYTLSVQEIIPQDSTWESSGVGVVLDDGVVFGKWAGFTNQRKALHFSVDQGIREISIYSNSYDNPSQGYTTKFLGLQLEQGDQATQYEPHGAKNLFDISKVETKENPSSESFLRNLGDRLKIKTPENSALVTDGLTFSQYCPELRIGDEAILTAKTTGETKFIWLNKAKTRWDFGTQKTITQEILDSAVGWYASGVKTEATISEIMVRYAGTSPDYEPHTGSLIQSTDNLCSLKLKATGQLFLSTAKSAQLVTIGTDYGNLQSQRVVLYVGAKVASGDYDEVCLGSFVVHEQKVDLEKGMTTFNLLDDITLLSNIPYSANEVQFPCTVQKLIEKMSAINNFEIGTDLSKLPNASYTIEEDLWGKINGTTYRSTLDEVAGATACMVNLKGFNRTIVFRNPEKVSQETLTYQNLKKVKFGGYYGKLNTVTLSRQPQEDNITVSNAEMVKIDGNKQAKLANNEILDDDREILATPILKAVEGYGFYETQIETEGHLWYEVGDRLTITDGTQSWETVVTDIDITVDGGVSEKLVCKAPAKAETNYSTTGSIYKSIWNTEIKVDKQGNQITSVVQQQNQLGDRVEDQFSKIEQDLHSITSSVQTIGGGNIIKNSVGYAKNADGKLSFWNKPVGDVKAVTSPESVSFGAISGNEIDLASDSSIAQKVNVAVQEGSLYSLTAFVKKPAVGACRIRAYNEIDNFVIDIANEQEMFWDRVELVGFKPSMGYLVVELENIDADAMAVTDLMLSLGDTSTAWQQAPSEILNTQVALTEDGVKVQSSVYAGDYVEITPLEFAGYSNAEGTTEKVFSLNRDTTQVSKINIDKQMYMSPIKVIPIKEGSQAGLVFVKSEEA